MFVHGLGKILVLYLQIWTSARSTDRYAHRLLAVRTLMAHTGVSARKVLSWTTARIAKVTALINNNLLFCSGVATNRGVGTFLLKPVMEDIDHTWHRDK